MLLHITAPFPYTKGDDSILTYWLYTTRPPTNIVVITDIGKPMIGNWTHYYMEANETYFGMGYQGEAPFLSLSRDEHNIPQHAWMFYSARLFTNFGAKNAPDDSHTHLKYCDVGKYDFLN